MKAELCIAVRTLVEAIHQGGDLRIAFTGASRSLEGIRAHRKVQNARPEGYTAEVPVAVRHETNLVVLNVSGRVDGVYSADGGTIVDEIKTTSADPRDFAPDQYPVHWSQAKVYAYMVATDRQLDRIGVQLTYYQLGTGRIREFRRTFRTAVLEQFFHQLIERYIEWASTVARWRQIRDESIQALEFPFARYRPGQREMAVAVYRTIRENGQILLQAATGIGKTMGVVFPTIKAMAEGRVSIFFYLTARTTGKTVAEQALGELRERGLRFKSITLTAKERICFCPDSVCSPDECPYAKGHYDRVGPAIGHGFSREVLDRKAVEDIAAAHRVCPFAFSLATAQWMDAVVCDYNYAFDPRVHLRQFFQESAGDCIFLIDEAHNLVDRSREMFSAEIRKQPFLDLRRAVKGELPELHRLMGKINTELLKIHKTCRAKGGSWTTDQMPENLSFLSRAFLKIADRWLSLNIQTDFRNDLLELYFAVASFVRVSESFDKTYSVCCRQEGRDLRVKLFCMDPSRQMGEALKRCRSSVFFSATLTPPGYFQQILGCDPDARRMRIPSPFPPENLGTFILNGVSTLYRQRFQTAQQVAEALLIMARHRPGNYLFYFPSYAYMEMVLDCFQKDRDGIRIVLQKPGMSEAEREAFINAFDGGHRIPLAGFAVMGGMFGEGIDLAGDRLTGVAVVGVGLPAISPERELIRKYFRSRSGDGYAFAYVYPGINRVLQAAGRVIRSGKDRGAVLLIDARYATGRYASLFPEEWRPLRIQKPSDVRGLLHEFWSEQQTEGLKRPVPCSIPSTIKGGKRWP